MLHAVHLLFIALYVLAPPIAVAITLMRSGPHHLRHISRLFFTMFVATLLGTAGTVAYALAVAARAGIGQIAMSIYFATAVLLILRSFDFLLRSLFAAARQPRSLLLVNCVRIVGLVVIGLPYVISAVAIYRPQVTPRDSDLLGVRPIEFASSDGISLAGRWLPAISGNNGAT